MDFENPEDRKAVQAMIAEVEGKPCVNVDTHDGGVIPRESSLISFDVRVRPGSGAEPGQGRPSDHC
ncbi:hypothetical protein [Paludisphaera soli]|uniref:hypothetical protein n=1 Tax=Paludisphaera soli TaxID=2712865 RepID=UPI0013EB04D7|nr:hypothetical protein [Paludisphaera soli]